MNSFGSRSTLKLGPREFEIYRLDALEKQLDAAGAPPTPGRLPDWKGGK